MGRLIKRHAVYDTLANLIKKADYDTLERALSKALGDFEVEILDPWSLARNVVDDSYIREIYVHNAEDVAERVRGLVSKWQIVEFDANNGDLISTYTDLDDFVQSKDESRITELAKQHDNADSFCLAYDKMDVEDLWLVTRSCFNDVAQLLNKAAKNNAKADDNWYEYAREWLEENEIDPNADCVFCINMDYKFVSFYKANVDQVVLDKLCTTYAQRDALEVELTNILFGI